MAPRKKAAPKKTAVKKTAAKKTSAKKTATRKTAAKKGAPKKVDNRCHFFRLPPELREMIYKYVYADKKVVSTTLWILVGKKISTPFSNYLIPRSLCTHLLVDKRYFEEAVVAYLRILSLSFDKLSTVCQVFRIFPILELNVTSVSIHVDLAVCDEDNARCILKIVERCPRLVNLTICCSPGPFQDIQNVALAPASVLYEWYHNTALDWMGIRKFRRFMAKLSDLRGLYTFHFDVSCIKWPSWIESTDTTNISRWRATFWPKFLELFEMIAEDIRPCVTTEPDAGAGGASVRRV